METQVMVLGNTLLVSMGEEIDHHCSGRIKGKIDAYLFEQPIQNVIFDFSNTKFMDSSGIGIVLGRYRLLKGIGGTVKVIHISEAHDRMFQMSGVYEMVEKAESTVDALQEEPGNAEAATKGEDYRRDSAASGAKRGEEPHTGCEKEEKTDETEAVSEAGSPVGE